MPTIQITMLGRFAVTVDGVPVAEASWTRRHAAALVKVLALAPGRRLHREQLIDLVWPDDTLDEAAPKLHKAAHFARRAIDVPDAVVLRGDHVVLLPRRRRRPSTSCGSRSWPAGRSPTRTSSRPRRALALYGGELLPQDRYDRGPRSGASSCACATSTCCASTAGGSAWSSSTPATSAAHLALMRRHAANGDRHAALRQFERLDRALRRELGVAPGREAVEPCATACSPTTTSRRRRRRRADRPRPPSWPWPSRPLDARGRAAAAR